MISSVVEVTYFEGNTAKMEGSRISQWVTSTIGTGEVLSSGGFSLRHRLSQLHKHVNHEQ